MSNYPLNYQLLNESSTKDLNVVVEFEGVDTKFSLAPVGKRIRYGDANLFYGTSNVVYGGIMEIPTIKPYLTSNSNLVVSQKIEPEQGRASASILSLEFIDKDGFMTNFVSPGQQMNEVLGGKLVKVYMGYASSSFKEDYFVVFRGYVTGVRILPTKVLMQLTDANFKRKQQSFLLGKSKISLIDAQIPAASVDITNDWFNVSEVLFNYGDIVTFGSTGTLPGNISFGTNYYVRDVTSTTFRVSDTLGGTHVNMSSQGTGVHTCRLVSLSTTGTKIALDKTAGFVSKITDMNGAVDSSCRTFLKCENEYMEYDIGAITSTHINVTRGANSTLSAIHNAQTDIENIVEIKGNIIDIALKLMLSGTNGYWKTGVGINSFKDTGDTTLGLISNAIVLKDNKDAVEDLGLASGDKISIISSSSGNNGDFIVSDFDSANGYANNVVYLLGANFTVENPSVATFSIRSQYDTLPVECGSKLKPVDVDISTFQYIKNTFFSQGDSVVDLFIKDPQSSKELIEKELMLPFGAYSLTRFGRLSMGVTKPPIIGQNLVVLNNTNVIEPQNISVNRALNNRRFWNEIQYFYDYDDSDTARSITSRLDTDSLNIMDTSSVLPIQARGLRTALGAETLIARRGEYLLKRFKDAAYEIQLKANWTAVGLIEAGDVVALYDNGDLMIANFATGERDLGSQLFEVIERSLDIKSGVGTLTLLSSLGYQVTDRFGTISPSSLVGIGSTVSEVVITDSYGALFPGNEKKKWTDFVGEKIVIHNKDFSISGESTLLGFADGDPYTMLLSTPLGFTPTAGFIVDIASYPDTTSKTDNEKYKLFFSFIDPSLLVASGASDTQFDVASGDETKIVVGLQINVRNNDYSRLSSDVVVSSIVGQTVTVASSLGFTPQVGDHVELVGFKDGQGGYRIL